MKELLRRFIQWLWLFLPDKCEAKGCPRAGTRGNENVVDGRVLCDDCSQGGADAKQGC